jgi:spoIIIJ-associated protein
MSPCIEFEAKNVKKAVQLACEALNVNKDQLDYKVVSYGSTGIFGLVGSKKAKIKVTPNNHTPPEEMGESQESCKLVTEEEAADTDLSNTGYEEETVLPLPTKIELPADDEAIRLGETVLEQILDTITTDATITSAWEADEIIFDLKASNPAVLIGKKGQTLEAIQYLTEKIINKGRKERIRVRVDVENYMNNRREYLQKTAGRLAQKTKRNGKPSTLGQLNPHDRRIVHIALKDDHRVRTMSVGEGFLRKLMIYPRKKNTRSRKAG